MAALCPSGRAEQKSQLVVSLVPKCHKYASICQVVHDPYRIYHREHFKGVDLYVGAVQSLPVCFAKRLELRPSVLMRGSLSPLPFMGFPPKPSLRQGRAQPEPERAQLPVAGLARAHAELGLRSGLGSIVSQCLRAGIRGVGLLLCSQTLLPPLYCHLRS